MAVGVKVRNPQSTHTTTNILKTKSGGRKSSLTEERVTVSVKSLCSFDSKKKYKKMSSSIKDLSEL